MKDKSLLTEQRQSLKKDIARIYNEVNKEIFQTGVIQLRVEVTDEKILIFGLHKRDPALQILEKVDGTLTMWADSLLIDEFKKRFKYKMETIVGLNVFSVLKDYDPSTGSACMTIILKKNELA